MSRYFTCRGCLPILVVLLFTQHVDKPVASVID